jgi:hypothetical protein
MFKNITYEDALKFRNFFNSTCYDDYMRILDLQSKKISLPGKKIENGFNANSDSESDNYTNMFGGRSLKHKYKSRKTRKQIITKNKYKSRKALKMQNKK